MRLLKVWLGFFFPFIFILLILKMFLLEWWSLPSPPLWKPSIATAVPCLAQRTHVALLLTVLGAFSHGMCLNWGTEQLPHYLVQLRDHFCCGWMDLAQKSHQRFGGNCLKSHIIYHCVMVYPRPAAKHHTGIHSLPAGLRKELERKGKPYELR